MDNNRAGEFTGPAAANPARDGPLVPDLLTRARTGDKQAWDALVERYAPLIWSICGTYQLGRADAQDVGQRVWLRLVDHRDKIRDPAALPGWLATTTRRECGLVLGTARRLRAPVYAPDPGNLPDEQAGPVDQALLAAERHAALREALSRLPPDGQQPDRHAHRGPAGPLCRDQRQARHPRRQHRPEPPPLPGQATP